MQKTDLPAYGNLFARRAAGAAGSATAANPLMAGKPHWWQWPTILSLDAPAVAVAWQWLFAHTAGDPLAPHHYLILGAGVWLVYAADRWLEGWLLAPAEMQTHRHRFYQRHRQSTLLAGIGIMLVSTSTAYFCLTQTEFRSGLVMLSPVLIYLLSHQLVHRDHPWRIPKEFVVAVLFAAGVACFTLVRHPATLSLLAIPLTLFGLLCFANCALISIWEDEVDRNHGQTSLALQYPGGRKFVHALPWIIAVIAAGFAWRESGGLRAATLCVMSSGLLLGCVDRLHRRSGRQLARVLADFVLLTPVVVWLIQTWSL